MTNNNIISDKNVDFDTNIDYDTNVDIDTNINCKTNVVYSTFVDIKCPAGFAHPKSTLFMQQRARNRQETTKDSRIGDCSSKCTGMKCQAMVLPLELLL
jgi:hypothetical protein